MDAFEKFDRDARDGQIDFARVGEELVRLHVELSAARQIIEELSTENADLKKRLADATKPAAAAKVSESYSLGAEEKRQRARGRGQRKESKKQRRGRIANEKKIALAERTQDIYPDGVPPAQCRLSHVRVVWRIENGRPLRVAYRIFRSSRKQYGVIPGVLGRSEFGLEVVVTVAYLVHVMGLSLDKACAALSFLQNLTLSKSQADALLNQLSRHWSNEFENLCTLLANSLVVHTDETSWSINSVWAFFSEKARVLLFGVHKDAATLQALLNSDVFTGLVISDDAAVYANFTNAQKCWAHLLRKAIKLTLLDPENVSYREFTDDLLEIYREANRVQRDQRLSAAGREQKVADLVEDVCVLCAAVRLQEPRQGTLGYEHRLLALEIQRLARKGELFTFVTAEPVAQPNGTRMPIGGTNNEGERGLRHSAQARDTGRTSKTLAGARRTTIITSVLQSLRLYVKTYTLNNIIEEIKSWQKTGQSCFQKLLDKLKLTLPDQKVLDRVLPNPSG